MQGPYELRVGPCLSERQLGLYFDSHSDAFKQAQTLNLSPSKNAPPMKRTLLAGTFYALAGAATLLLAASIVFSCRTGGDPHHERNSHGAPAEETHSSGESHSSVVPETTPNGMRLTLPNVPPRSHRS